MSFIKTLQALTHPHKTTAQDPRDSHTCPVKIKQSLVPKRKQYNTQNRKEKEKKTKPKKKKQKKKKKRALKDRRRAHYAQYVCA